MLYIWAFKLLMEIKALPIAHYTDWILILFVCCALMLLVSKLAEEKRFYIFLTLPFHTKKMEVLSEFNPFNGIKRFETLLSLHSYLLISFGIFILSEHLGDSKPNYGYFESYVRICFFVSLFYLGKALINAFLEWIYDHPTQIALAGNLSLGYRIWSSIFLLPLAFFCIFFNDGTLFFVWAIGIFLAVSYILSVFQSNLILWQIPAPFYYKFFYICALEITPILFLVKWLI